MAFQWAMDAATTAPPPTTVVDQPVPVTSVPVGPEHHARIPGAIDTTNAKLDRMMSILNGILEDGKGIKHRLSALEGKGGDAL